MKLPKKILVATDLSESCVPVIKSAREWAVLCGAELHLVHVFDPVPYPSYALSEAFVLDQKLIEQIESEIHARLKDIRSTYLTDLDKVEAVAVRHHSPWQGLTTYAEDERIDLIIIGSHGRTGLARVVLGSVAEKVVQRASCAVLVLRTGPES